MTSTARIALFALTFAVLLKGAALPNRCLAWSLASQPVEGVLVLRNGNILRGKIQQQGKHYHVHMPNGSLQVREQQVDMVCQNLEEAYQRRRESRGSTVDSHLELAGWCLRHELYSHAETELEAAEAIDATHRRLPLMRRQLTHILQMDALKRRQQIQQAAAPVEPMPLDEESLDKAPRWARTLFVRQIQPLVVHSCGTGGCHQVGSDSSFQLNRLAIDGVGHPDATLRNLSTTLAQIDWQSAQQSELLQRAKLAHGSETSSTPLPRHKLQVLQGWVEQLAEAHRKDRELRTLPQLAEAEAPVTTPRLELIPPQQPTAQPPSGIRTASYEPADPFDPSVFNDRYAAAKTPAAEAPAPEKLAGLHPAPSVPHVLAPSAPTLIPLPAPE